MYVSNVSVPWVIAKSMGKRHICEWNIFKAYSLKKLERLLCYMYLLYKLQKQASLQIAHMAVLVETKHLHLQCTWKKKDTSCNYVIMSKVQWETKLLGQLTHYALISPPFPLSPKQCCSLCSPVHFSLSWKCFVIPTLFGGGRGPFLVSTWLEKCILHYIWLFDKLRMWKQDFP